ncbi:MAG: hypothetical protein ACRCSI_00850, partial [Eubacterium aggregans]
MASTLVPTRWCCQISDDTLARSPTMGGQLKRRWVAQQWPYSLSFSGQHSDDLQHTMWCLRTCRHPLLLELRNGIIPYGLLICPCVINVGKCMAMRDAP